MKYDVDKISKKIQKKKFLKKLFNFIVVIILFIFFFISVLVSSVDEQKKTNSKNSSYYAFDIISGSMIPTLNINDIIIVKKIDYTKLKNDDIITFEKDNKIISHRIIKISKKDGNTVFYTKGDNNELVDEDTVYPEEIYGIVLYKIPYIGLLAKEVKNKSIMVVASVLLIFIWLFVGFIQQRKFKRKKTRKKYEVNKILEKYN